MIFWDDQISLIVRNLSSIYVLPLNFYEAISQDYGKKQ